MKVAPFHQQAERNSAPRRELRQRTPQGSAALPHRLRATLGNQDIQRILRLGLQAKLSISNPQDEYEQEADRVATEVMRVSEPDVLSHEPQIAGLLRMCSGCTEAITRSQHGQEPDDGIAQRVSTGIDGAIADLKNGGRPLPGDVRRFFESRFGRDFGAVRIHTDARSAELSRAINAAAFTAGADLVFGAGHYQPDSIEGRRLLAHELAHVVQQGRAGQLWPPNERPNARASAPASDFDSGVLRRGDVSETYGSGQAVTVPYGKGLNRHGRLDLADRVSTRPPQVQRLFVAFGTLPDVNALLNLIGPPSGLNLNLNVGINQVQIAGAPSATPRSRALQTELTTIINHATQHAEIIVGRGQPEVEVGAFPQPSDMTVTRVQQIDIDDILAIEAGAPGNGVAAVAHEIQENFNAHAAAPVAGTNLFPLAHQAAVETESDVAVQLVGPGRHVAMASAQTGPTTRTEIVDYENYFLVFTATVTAATHNVTVSNARRAAPVNVSRRTLDNFGPGSAALPAGAAAVIAAAVTDVGNSPTSTVLIEGFSDAAPGGGLIAGVFGLMGSLLESQQRADAVLNALQGAGVPPIRMHATGQGPTNFVAANDTEPHRALNRRVVITVRRPGP